jgi:hypothetical protein
VRELGPARAAEQLGRLRVAEDARRVLGEDSVARERAKDAPQALRIDAHSPGELLDRERVVRELVGDAEIGDDPQRLRRHRSAKEVPEQFCRLARAHLGIRDL